MAYYCGKNYTKEQLLRRIGNTAQLGGVKSYTLNEGRASQTKALDIQTGELSLTVLPSRCLDIASASYHGIPFGYLSKSGIRGPEYFVERGEKGFLDNFFGGLLTTSGLCGIGSPGTVEGREYGLHGEISNVPAENVCVKEYWEEDELLFEISGAMRHSRFYGEDLLLERTVRTALGSKRIILRDVIENQDFKEIPLFFLYHINFGFPFVDQDARILFPPMEKMEARTPSAQKGLAGAASMRGPGDGLEEECFYCYFRDTDIVVTLFNPSLGARGMYVYLKYDAARFPEFIEWKLMRSREYVCGFAPATNRLEGRERALREERVRYLQPMERAVFEIEIGVGEGVPAWMADGNDVIRQTDVRFASTKAERRDF